MADTRIDELRRRLDRDPGSRLFAQLAEEHRKAGDHTEAIRVARAGLALHSAYPSARLTLGRALLDSGDPAGAKVELAEVLREAPDNILASRFLGQALEMTGDLAGAVRQYSATLKMTPGDRQLEAQLASLRLRAQSGGPVGTAVTAPVRPVAPPLPPSAAARPAAAVGPASGPVGTAPPPRTGVPPPVRPPVPPPPPTDRMAPGGASPSEATILIRPPAGASPQPLPGAGSPSPAVGSSAGAEVSPTPTPSLLGGRLAEAPVAMGRPLAQVPMNEEPDNAPTLPRAVAPDPSAFVSTLPPAKPPGPGPGDAVETEYFAEELDSPAAATAELAVPAASPADTVGGDAPVAVPAPSPADTVGGDAGGGDAKVPARKGPGDAAAETLSPGEPAPAAAPIAPGAPLSSSTLAELYLRQGLTERAREVYRQVLAEDPLNGRAQAGLRDLESAAPPDPRAARRAALQRTIAALEAMLAAVRRD